MSDNKATTQRRAIPRDTANDYTLGSTERRRAFLREASGVELTHVAKYSFDPSLVQGNIENFIGRGPSADRRRRAPSNQRRAR